MNVDDDDTIKLLVFKVYFTVTIAIMNWNT